eukprot:gb/GEZN01019975.1/.p1 GENE.gb/GEZN01019975.1/~~gb/GEZN01019975.1/.p1  ORF type:complete len:188 (-),score=17.03 gb/GEZN01019975.1/:136-675(-)
MALEKDKTSASRGDHLPRLLGFHISLCNFAATPEIAFTPQFSLLLSLRPTTTIDWGPISDFVSHLAQDEEPRSVETLFPLRFKERPHRVSLEARYYFSPDERPFCSVRVGLTGNVGIGFGLGSTACRTGVTGTPILLGAAASTVLGVKFNVLDRSGGGMFNPVPFFSIDFIELLGSRWR